MKIHVTIHTNHSGTRPTRRLEWEADDYDAEPYGEAIATLLRGDPQLERIDQVQIVSETGKIRTYRRLDDVHPALR